MAGRDFISAAAAEDALAEDVLDDEPEPLFIQAAGTPTVVAAVEIPGVTVFISEGLAPGVIGLPAYIRRESARLVAVWGVAALLELWQAGPGWILAFGSA